ncbi:MAG: 16S rRNA processing protein RimM [bacterium]|jgi:16S rRNA processing protein RimM
MLVVLGRVKGAHGVRGTLKCEYVTDRPATLQGYAYFILSDEITGEAVIVRHPKVSLRGTDFLLSTPSVPNRNVASGMSGWLVEAPASLVPPRSNGEFFPWQLVGLCTVNESGAELGFVQDVFFTAAGAVLQIQGVRGEILLAFSGDAVIDVDLPGGRLVVTDYVGN